MRLSLPLLILALACSSSTALPDNRNLRRRLTSTLSNEQSLPNTRRLNSDKNKCTGNKNKPGCKKGGGSQNNNDKDSLMTTDGSANSGSQNDKLETSNSRSAKKQSNDKLEIDNTGKSAKQKHHKRSKKTRDRLDFANEQEYNAYMYDKYQHRGRSGYGDYRLDNLNARNHQSRNNPLLGDNLNDKDDHRNRNRNPIHGADDRKRRQRKTTHYSNGRNHDDKSDMNARQQQDQSHHQKRKQDNDRAQRKQRKPRPQEPGNNPGDHQQRKNADAPRPQMQSQAQKSTGMKDMFNKLLQKGKRQEQRKQEAKKELNQKVVDKVPDVVAHTNIQRKVSVSLSKSASKLGLGPGAEITPGGNGRGKSNSMEMDQVMDEMQFEQGMVFSKYQQNAMKTPGGDSIDDVIANLPNDEKKRSPSMDGIVDNMQSDQVEAFSKMNKDMNLGDQKEGAGQADVGSQDDEPEGQGSQVNGNGQQANDQQPAKDKDEPPANGDTAGAAGEPANSVDSDEDMYDKPLQNNFIDNASSDSDAHDDPNGAAKDSLSDSVEDVFATDMGNPTQGENDTPGNDASVDDNNANVNNQANDMVTIGGDQDAGSADDGSSIDSDVDEIGETLGA